MKRYRLLKDLPYAKAGEIFIVEARIRKVIAEAVLTNSENEEVQFWMKDIKDFNDWFEELPEIEIPFQFFFIYGTSIGTMCEQDYWKNIKTKQEYIKNIDEYKRIGNYFETLKEAKEHLAYLKAKETIRQDTKGFQPDWNNFNQPKWCGIWDSQRRLILATDNYTNQTDNIYFKSEESIEGSIDTHYREWKLYLTYKQKPQEFYNYS